ncbi:hypothetical protein SNEBB_001403 [Seison nebaliae]|nr:hypothetical protein SNEBB_001403 [Seison nebaliae]
MEEIHPIKFSLNDNGRFYAFLNLYNHSVNASLLYKILSNNRYYIAKPAICIIPPNKTVQLEIIQNIDYPDEEKVNHQFIIICLFHQNIELGDREKLQTLFNSNKENVSRIQFFANLPDDFDDYDDEGMKNLNCHFTKSHDIRLTHPIIEIVEDKDYDLRNRNNNAKKESVDKGQRKQKKNSTEPYSDISSTGTNPPSSRPQMGKNFVGQTYLQMILIPVLLILLFSAVTLHLRNRGVTKITVVAKQKTMRPHLKKPILVIPHQQAHPQLAYHTAMRPHPRPRPPFRPGSAYPFFQSKFPLRVEEEEYQEYPTEEISYGKVMNHQPINPTGVDYHYGGVNHRGRPGGRIGGRPVGRSGGRGSMRTGKHNKFTKAKKLAEPPIEKTAVNTHTFIGRNQKINRASHKIGASSGHMPIVQSNSVRSMMVNSEVEAKQNREIENLVHDNLALDNRNFMINQNIGGNNRIVRGADENNERSRNLKRRHVHTLPTFQGSRYRGVRPNIRDYRLLVKGAIGKDFKSHMVDVPRLHPLQLQVKSLMSGDLQVDRPVFSDYLKTLCEQDHYDRILRIKCMDTVKRNAAKFKGKTVN